MLKFFRGFSFAFAGIWIAIKTQVNFRIQLICSFIVLYLGEWLGLRNWEWVTIILCIGVVLGAEALNTAVEELTNIVSPEINPRAGQVKDLAAAAVLIICIAVLIIGLIIFLPKLLHYLNWYAG